jgi:hypothetical protein
LIEIQSTGMPGMEGKQLFKGEQALVTALRELREGKKKATIYFTQDSGELSIDEAAVRTRREVPPQRSALSLKTKLEQAGYAVKSFSLGERVVTETAAPKVPDDAAVVIVADPLKLTAEKAAVLEAYLKRPTSETVEPGRLIVMADVHFGTDGKVAPSGLESVMMNFGVKIGQEYVFGISPFDDPTVFPMAISPQGMDPEIVRTIFGLLTSSNLVLQESRSITPVPANAAFDAQVLLYASTDVMVPPDKRALWTEPSQVSNPNKYVSDLIKSRDILKKVGEQPPSVAVTVRDRAAQPPPRNPFGQPPQPEMGKPRLCVFGDASFVTDAHMEREAAGGNLILTTLAWLRGKTELAVDVPPKEQKSYRLAVPKDTLDRVFWYPLIWLLLAVIATGIGVGILRRR